MSSSSSAEPQVLIRYSADMLALDAQLVAASARLAAVLNVFEFLCQEPGLRVEVSHFPGKVTGCGSRAQSVDAWVGLVGINFKMADQGALLATGIRDRWLPEWWWMVPLSWCFTPTNAQLRLPYIPVCPPRPAANMPVQTHTLLPSNLADLFVEIEEASSDITIIQLNDDEYLILVQGTESWTQGSDTWVNALFSGVGLESDYTEKIRQAIADAGIPRGATLNFAGFSQGGHAIQIVANEYAANKKYEIRNLIGFGTYFVDAPHQRIEHAQIYNFIHDPLVLVDALVPDLAPLAVEHPRREKILLDSVTINPADAHGAYEKSRTLQQMPISWNVGGGYPKTIKTVDSSSGPRQAVLNTVQQRAAASWAWGVETVKFTSDRVSSFSNSVADSL